MFGCSNKHHINIYMPAVKYIQGTFIPKNKEKYNGVLPIIYRSSYERKFMGFLDNNPAVIKWSSESIVIPYLNVVKKKVCRYFPDFYIKILEKNGQIKEYLIEIKPEKETTLPIKTKGMRTASHAYAAATYLQNLSKWVEAKKYAEKRGWTFKLVTEKDLGI